MSDPAPSASPASPRGSVTPAPIAILGVPFDNTTMAGTLARIEAMIASRRPHYVATANVDFVTQAMGDVELRRILAEADLVLCDGMPLVWASRFLGNPLPERVTGSDLTPLLLAEGEKKGWRIFFLGGAENARAAEVVRAKYPRLQLVGAYSPPFKALLEMDHEDMLRRIREARPDILLVAFGCPKQEKWINMHYRQAGVPVCIGVGATLDFLAGTVRRAPVWMRRTGLEWFFRMAQEPRRMVRRYATDFWVFGRGILRQWWRFRTVRSAARKVNEVTAQSSRSGAMEVVRFPARLDAATVQQHAELWPRLLEQQAHLLLELTDVTFIDSTGMGLLVRLQKQLRAAGRQLVLVAPPRAVVAALKLMGFADFFPVAPDLAAARDLAHARVEERNVLPTLDLAGGTEPLAWQGDIVAANEPEVWRLTLLQLELAAARGGALTINLAAVRFIDSAGVGLMVRIRKEGRARNVGVAFVEPQPAVLNVLRILRLESFLLG